MYNSFLLNLLNDCFFNSSCWQVDNVYVDFSGDFSGGVRNENAFQSAISFLIKDKVEGLIFKETSIPSIVFFDSKQLDSGKKNDFNMKINFLNINILIRPHSRRIEE